MSSKSIARQCPIRGCENPIRNKNLCNKHRLRLERHGSPFILKDNKHLSPEERFNLKYKVCDLTGCHIWTGHKNRLGYGTFSIKCKPIPAHRYIWQVNNHAIPKGMYICHHCDNPSCVKLEHLFLGTPMDNTHDMISKGRDRHAKGSEHHAAKLTESEVMLIRGMAGKTTNVNIAKTFGVSPSSIGLIIKRKIWTHV